MKLHIPHESVDAAARQIHSSFDTAAPMERFNARETAMEALTAALPLVVAAELDRIAAGIERRSDNVPMSADGRGIERVGTLREIAGRVRARAAELRAGE